MHPILWIIAITLLPFLELRASIPWGVLATNLHWSVVLIVAVIANIVLGIVIYWLVHRVIHLFFFIKPFKKAYDYYITKTQKKIHKVVDKYGEWAVAIFIGIPLPGSGVYTGAIASYIIGLEFKKFIIACIVGVLIAGIVVLLISLTGAEFLRSFIKII